MMRSLVLASLALPLLAADAPKQPPKAEGIEFDSAYIVFLRRPADAKAYDEAKLQEIQKAHLGHLGDLYKAGVVDVAGPFDEQDEPALRGLAIYPARLGKDEVRRLAENDPAVKAGRLEVKIVRWYFQKGAVAFAHPGR